MSHDYAKSPLMEDVHNNEDNLSEPKDEIIEIDLEPTDEAITKFDPRTKQLFDSYCAIKLETGLCRHSIFIYYQYCAF